MDIQRLRYFVAVADELHFGRAAEKLMMTASPLSKQIRQLERELGGDLFVRDHHSVQLTPLGHSMLTPIRDVLARLDALKDLATPRYERLHVGATPFAPPQLVDECLALLAQAAAGVPVETSLAPSVQLLPRLEAGKLDLAVVHSPVPDDAFRVAGIGSYDSLVVMREDDPLSSREGVCLEDLADGVPLAVAVYPSHPEHMRDRREQMRAAGITNVFEVSNAGTQVIPAHVRLQGMRTLVGDLPGHPAVMAYRRGPYVLVPLTDPDMRTYVVVAALRAKLRQSHALRGIFHRLEARLDARATPGATTDVVLASA